MEKEEVTKRQKLNPQSDGFVNISTSDPSQKDKKEEVN